MAAEVCPLVIAPRPVNGDAVEILEDALARVKAGETEAVALVEVRVAGEVTLSWSNCSTYHALNSGCARLAAKIALVEDE